MFKRNDYPKKFISNVINKVMNYKIINVTDRDREFFLQINDKDDDQKEKCIFFYS